MQQKDQARSKKCPLDMIPPVDYWLGTVPEDLQDFYALSQSPPLTVHTEKAYTRPSVLPGVVVEWGRSGLSLPPVLWVGTGLRKRFQVHAQVNRQQVGSLWNLPMRSGCGWTVRPRGKRISKSEEQTHMSLPDRQQEIHADSYNTWGLVWFTATAMLISTH